MLKQMLQVIKMLSIQERLKIPTESIDGSAWQWACMLRSSIPAKVVSFDADTQTCVVQVVIQEVVLKPPPATSQVPNPGTTQNIPTTETIPNLEDVPIIMMRVPGWSLTFPIVEGTECLIIFADMCIDGWWQNGGINPQFDKRRHDLSDGLALFGPWSQPNKLPSYSTTSVQLRSDDLTTLIDVSSVAITIKSPNKIVLESPEVDAKSISGTPLPLVNDNWYQWWLTNVYTFLQGLGYAGPPPPTDSETTVLKGV